VTPFINLDGGELPDESPELWAHFDILNIACGGHAGDAASMTRVIEHCIGQGVSIGGHPSYPDREHFGRRSMQMAPDALRASLRTQIAALGRFAPVHHVKPHGALYNDAHKDRALADVVVSALDADIALVAPDHSQMAAAARAAGIRVIREAFADRRYEPDGSLTPRSIAGSTLTVEEAVAQAALLAREGVVIARDRTRVAITFDTICVHADMEGAVQRLRAIRSISG
jgi:UPF0271 protein